MVEQHSLSDLLVVDFGSTTTKARLFRKDTRWRLFEAAESPTTVEDPHCDVTVGLQNAVRNLELKINQTLIKSDNRYGDFFLATSSAGGGLQVIVLAATNDISAKRAERAAMLAGAIILKTFTLDSSYSESEIIQDINKLKPDIVLICGGFENSPVAYIEKFSELLVTANPKPRFGQADKIPVILCGPKKSNSKAKMLLSDFFLCFETDNVSESLVRYNLQPTINLIHDIFVEHVMKNAPGYDKVLNLTSGPPQPTPIAAGKLVKFISERIDKSVLSVDIGGATTDIFSSDKGGRNFIRTVSANFGMSYSCSNVLNEAEKQLNAQIANDTKVKVLDKMLRPALLPITLEQLKLEHYLAKMALRLSISQHKTFKPEMEKPEIVIGSGGVLSHCPFVDFGSLILTQGFQLSGLVELTVDKLFLLPHLGILSDYFEEAALEIFFQDCLKPLSLLVRPDYYFKIPGVKRTLAKVIINDKFEFELIESKRIFIRLGEKVRKIFIKPNLFVQFDNVVLEPLVDGYRCVCLDGTKLDQPLENFSF